MNDPVTNTLTPREPTLEGAATIADAARSIAHFLEADANVTAAFGAPMRLDTHTVIPVARVVSSGGGGGLGSLGAKVGAVKRLLFGGTRETAVSPGATAAGAGGVSVVVTPIGFLHEDGGRVVFTPIDGHPRAARP